MTVMIFYFMSGLLVCGWLAVDLDYVMNSGKLEMDSVTAPAWLTLSMKLVVAFKD